MGAGRRRRILAPADGYAINVQLRPGAMTSAFPALPAMNFVEQTYQVIALFQQNELHAVEPGNEAEFTVYTSPGLIMKATVDSIVWAQAQGQMRVGQQLPQTGVGPQAEGRFPVKLTVDPKQAALFLPAGAIGPRRDLYQTADRRYRSCARSSCASVPSWTTWS